MAFTFKSVFNGLKKIAPVAGGIIGGVVGGPAGAAIGSSIGGAVAGGSNPKTTQYDAIPKDIQNLRSNTATYLNGAMGRLEPTAAQSSPTGFNQTQDVNSPSINGVYRATSGTAANNDGRYVGLNNFQPTQSTAATQYTGADSAGTGRTGSIMDQLLAAGQQGVNGQAQATLLNGGGNVSAQNVRGLTEGQQSVSDLATGGFMDKFLAQYQPLFEQQRRQAIAAAKEGSGNLTGSGFANTLGNATSQTLAQQQGVLADLARQGITTEVGRQQNLAGLENQRNLADASNALAASSANASNNLQGASAAGQLGLQANDNLVRALEASGNIELANLVREQGRLTTNAQTGADVALQNRNITSNEQGRNASNDLQRLTTLAGLQQNDAQTQAGRDQQTNLFNASESNSRDLALAQLKQQLGLSNRQLTSQENQFLASLLQNNNQFNAGQTNDLANANAQRIASLLGGLTTAGVGVPNITQQPSFVDSLISGATAAIPAFFNQGGNSGGATAPAIAGLDVRAMTPGGTPSGIPSPASFIPQPNLNVGSATGSPAVGPGMAGGTPDWARIMSGGPGGSPGPVSPFGPIVGQGDIGTRGGIDPAILSALGGATLQPGQSFGGPAPQPYLPPTTTFTGAPGLPPLAGGAPSSIAGAPASMQGFLAALKNQGNFGNTGGGLTNRSTFLSQLPQLRAA